MVGLTSVFFSLFRICLSVCLYLCLCSYFHNFRLGLYVRMS